MRKIVWTLLFVFLGLGVIYAQSDDIKIVSPTRADSYAQEQTIEIKWKKKANLHSQVKIALFDKNRQAKVRNISPGTANDGYLKWVIPANTNPDTYTIKIVTLDNKVKAYSDRFKITPKITWEAPTYAMISTFKVDNQSPANSCTNTSQRVSVNLPNGVHPSCTATSVIQPILYKFEMELTNPETGFDYVVFTRNWNSMSYCNINLSYNQVLDKVFPGGVSGSSIPLSLQGRVTVWVKNGAQTQQPQTRTLCIRLWI